MKRVVITGLGIISSLGNNKTEVKDSFTIVGNDLGDLPF